MRRTRIYLLAALCAALAVAHAANPGVALAEDATRLRSISDIGETCAGKCVKGMLCCKVIIVAPPA